MIYFEKPSITFHLLDGFKNNNNNNATERHERKDTTRLGWKL